MEHHNEPNSFKRTFYRIRDFLSTIAQRTYPFVERDEQGNKLYLDRAYNRRYGLCEAELGRMPNMKCWRIFIWREVLHLWLGIGFWAVALLIDYFVGTPWSLILPIVLLVYFTIQEFLVDRIKYHQPWLRGVIDWIIWGIPLILFILIHVI